MNRQRITGWICFLGFGLLCFVVGALWGADRALERELGNLREWKTIEASGDIALLADVRAHLNVEDTCSAYALIREEIERHQEVLRKYDSQMGDKERYHARNAALALEMDVPREKPDWNAIKKWLRENGKLDGPRQVHDR